MAKLARLFKHMFKVCKNGVVPSLKLVMALKNLHSRSPIYHRKDDIEAWAPQTGAKIRMVASFFRECAGDDSKKRTCLAKATKKKH